MPVPPAPRTPRLTAIEGATPTIHAMRVVPIAVAVVVLVVTLGLGAWYFFGSIASPNGLSAAPVHGTQIALDWTDTNDNEDGFIVERRVSDGAFSEIARVASDVTSYSDADVEIGTSYEYRVRAFHGWAPGFGFRRSGSSNEASVTVSVAPAIAGLALDPIPVRGGDIATGIVTLKSPAPPGGVTINVSSTNRDVVDVPDVVTVEAGLTAVELPAVTYHVRQPVEVAVVATLADSEVRATLLVEASSTTPVMSNVTFEPTPVTAEERTQLTAQRAQLISQLTGPGSPSRTDERWNIAGTDLGFSFEYQDKLFMVFGDTWGRDGVEGSDWRSNTMGIVEQDPEHGYVITDAVVGTNGEAKELLVSLKKPKEEYTVIPTTGISVDDRMYLHYMSIRDWDQKPWGYQEPVVNGAGLAYSDDGGRTWTKDETAWWPGNSNFTQAAMVRADGYVYMFGTPAGRFGPAKLLRVDEKELLNPKEYEYRAGDDWESDPNLAAEVIPAPVGELSVRWSDYQDKWFMMYTNEITHNIVLRSASQLVGPWSAEEVIVTSTQYPYLYAPFMLPIDGPEIHFTMSIFKPDYQVFLMKLAF